VSYVLGIIDLPLANTIDIGLFLDDDFTAVQNYNPVQGTANFIFNSTKANGSASVFKFTETAVAPSASGESRNTTYELSNTLAGVSFKGTRNFTETVTATGSNYNGLLNISYKDTQGTAVTADDISTTINFSLTGNSTASGDYETGTSSFSYTGGGLTLAMTGTFSTTPTSETINLSNYSLTYKNPDTAIITDNGTVGFAGKFESNGEKLTLTLSNLNLDFYEAKITTASAILQFTGDRYQGADEVVEKLSDVSETSESAGDFLPILLGLQDYGDGPSSSDSILDYANAIILKQSGSANVGAGNDTVTGSAGADTINAGSGVDLINAGDGGDFVFGGDGADVLNGDGGNDTIDGSSGADNINGGAGDDSLIGGVGNDIIAGGEGNDWILAGAGDNINGGGGTDTWSIDYDEIGSITGVTGSMAALTIAGKRTDDAGSSFSITANAVEVVLVGGVSYNNFNELKAALLPPPV
jgi:Ca2+-binding RTX toxin-like protein